MAPKKLDVSAMRGKDIIDIDPVPKIPNGSEPLKIPERPRIDLSGLGNVTPDKFRNTQFDNRSQRMAQLFAAGASNEEIAAHFDLAPGTIANLRSSPLMVQTVRKIQESIHRALIAETIPLQRKLKEQIDSHTEAAVSQIAHLMEHAESESVQLQASESILDRSEESPKKVKHVQQDTRSIHISIGTDEIREMAEAARELGEDFDGIDIEGFINEAHHSNDESVQLIEEPVSLDDWLNEALEKEGEQAHPFNRDDYF